MDDIAFVSLDDVDEKSIIALMNNEKVGKYLPLLNGAFTEEDCRVFLNEKNKLRDEHGYGPWAFYINGVFAGWGGLQPENGDADFALVLHPDFWGRGRDILDTVKDQAFNEMNLESITALLPPNRQNSNAIKRLGFAEDGEVDIDGQRFERFRLLHSQ